MNKHVLLTTLVLANAISAGFALTDRIRLRATSLAPPVTDGTAEPALPLSGEPPEEEWNLFDDRPAASPDPGAPAAGGGGGEVQRLGLKDRTMVAAATLEAPLRRRDRPGAARVACAPVSPAALALTGGCLGLWVLAACGTAIWKSIGQKAEQTVQLSSTPQRDPRWDRARFHLMTVIIWSHWVGKWGLQTTKAGWVVLNWAFAVHVIGFIFLSGAFSTRYAMKVQERGWKECVPVLWNCLDVFLVYLTFSWLRGVVSISMDSSHPSAHWIMTQTLKGTFAFHQAPWYLSALIMWRLSAFLHWRVPGMLVLSLLIGALCPYEALNKAHDPFAIREVMHYLPFFTLGILCGQERLEQMIDLCGKWRAVVGLVVLAGLAAVICIPLGPMFDDPTLRWVLLKKDVPPLDRGGFALMMLLYVVKTLAMLAALMLFVTPTNSILDRAIDTGGTRSMMVYMVHMVFIMEPGESLCMARYVHPEQSGCLSIVLLFILAFAVNVLCSSDFTATLFQPLLEPLATIGCLSTRAGVVWRMVSNKSI